jgi:hypothetical protein
MKLRVCRLLCVVLIGVSLADPMITRAEGLLYQLPEDGSWVRFDVRYTFKFEGLDQAGQGTITMASVGRTFEGSEECRWIEFNVQLKDSGTEHTLIRKLLIPVRYLKKGENATEHVIRGWAKFDDEGVEPAVPVHGRWPAYLAGPFQEEKRLNKRMVEGKLGALMCEGVTGWIQYSEGDAHTRVTYETWLHEKAPFGVVATRMIFEVTGGGPPRIDSTWRLTDFGKGAKSVLPDYH